MKKIINGKRFDTSKSITIGSFDNIGSGASSTTDFHYWEATLYKTPRSGQYFLAGSGGPMSRYAEASGNNSWSGGEGITPMSKEDAFEFAQQYLSTSEIEEEFSDMIEEA